MEDELESEALYKGPCEKCGSNDNKTYYDDGHTFCFTPGCGYGKVDEEPLTQSKEYVKIPGLIEHGIVQALPTRGLTVETCKRWNYSVGVHKGKPVQLANYYNEAGQVIAQKVRGKNKEFFATGDTKNMTLYGKSRCQNSGRKIIITEGELDALSVSQALNYRWPVVSLQAGAGNAKKSILKELQWLQGFEEVALCFDNDEAGAKAIEEVVALFPPGKVSIISLPLKDANEMLVEGRQEELIQALWGAKVYRPDGIVTVGDIKDKVLRDPEYGMPWCLPSLNELTFGRRMGEAVALGAGTGVGKTTFITQQIAQDLETMPVGVFAFEQAPEETVKRIAGMMKGQPFHIPGAEFDKGALEAAVQDIEDGPGLYLYDHFGACEWEYVKDRMRYLSHAYGVKIFYLDHLTALAAQEMDERKALEKIMAELGGLVKELDCWLLFVSHLSTPEGEAHEEGGRVKAKHFKGSRAIMFWSHFMFGIERDQQGGADSERSTLRCLKDRYTGRATGQMWDLSYSHKSGKFVEDPFEFDKAAKEEESDF